MKERTFYDGDKVDWVENNTVHAGGIVDGYFDPNVNDWAYLVRDTTEGCFTKIYQSELINKRRATKGF